MKKIFIIAGMMVAGATYAQDSSNNYKGNVGVNTTTPGATLDVNISKASGIKAELGQGIAFPRVSVSTLNAMTGNIVTSSMVYVTDVAGGSTIARTADVDAVGYYFFNDTKWTKLGGGAASTATETNSFTRVIRTTDQTPIVIDGSAETNNKDYFIYYTGSSTATVTLPSASANKGRVLCFYSGGETINTGAEGNAANVYGGYGACIISTGTNWISHTSA